MRMLHCLISLLVVFSTSVRAENFSLTSVDFLDKGILPVLYTCQGQDISPQLSWVNSPKDTKSFVLIMSDESTGDDVFYHWILYNLPNNMSEIKENEQNLPKDAMIGINSWNKLSYNGPCPPAGTAHTYVFTLYALKNKLNLASGLNAKTIIDALEGTILDKAEIRAIYSSWNY